MSVLRRAGFRTVTVSPFGERHGAWHWYAGYSEIYNPGKRGLEIADDVTPLALDWIQRNARSDNWFLHVNYWDPHTPYRTPEGFGNPFESDPLPAWLTEEARQRGWDGYGPHSPQEPRGWSDVSDADLYPRVPTALDSMEAVKQWMDGYDVGIRYADEHAGRLLNALADAGVLDDTIIMVSSDHGENQGELNVWGDHQTADVCTCRVPLVVRWPGVTDGGHADHALHYQYDWAATLVEMVGADIPCNWDAQPFTGAFRAGTDSGREYLVISQQAWSCQRSVRFGDYLCLRTYHDGLKDLGPVMLYDLVNDPHEQWNLADEMPGTVDRAMGMLAEWHHEMVTKSPSGVDPMMTVLQNGGPYHTRGKLPAYLDRLRSTGRAHHADALAARHRGEV
jgi:arylsulfatase A-like enzyme